MPTVKIEVLRNRGSFVEGEIREADEQVARQLVADGTARLVERVSKATLVTPETPSETKSRRSKRA